jgi:hypothetical protein
MARCHRPARSALAGAEVRLPAHVAFEATSALSRMPEGRRIAAAVVFEALQRGFTEPWLAMDGDGLGMPARAVHAIRDDLTRRVAALIDELDASAATHE